MSQQHSLFSIRTAWWCSNGCKSRTHPNGGKRTAKDKGVAASQCLKEAVCKLSRNKGERAWSYPW